MCVTVTYLIVALIIVVICFLNCIVELVMLGDLCEYGLILLLTYLFCT